MAEVGDASYPAILNYLVRQTTLCSQPSKQPTMDTVSGPIFFRNIPEGEGRTCRFRKRAGTGSSSISREARTPVEERSSSPLTVYSVAQAARATRSDSPPLVDNMELHEHIGVYGCVQCVGVYFPVDEDRCFCAHIRGKSMWARIEALVSETDGMEIEKQVVSKLEQLLDEDVWEPWNPKFASTIIVVCPVPELIDSEANIGYPVRLSGFWVAEGIRDFLRHQAAKVSAYSRYNEDRHEDASKLPWGYQKGYGAKAKRLKAQAERLHAAAENLIIDTESQGFIVEHAKIGDCQRAVFKVKKEQADSREGWDNLPADLGPFKPSLDYGPDPEEWVLRTCEDEERMLKMAQDVYDWEMGVKAKTGQWPLWW